MHVLITIEDYLHKKGLIDISGKKKRILYRVINRYNDQI